MNVSKLILSTLACFNLAISSTANIDDLPLNKIQVIGSHNSYKQAIDATLFKLMVANNPKVAGLDYEHIALGEQLDMGLRGLEIDIYADSKGGRYAHPKGMELVPQQAPFNTDHKMDEPGFKVFHVIDYDYRSHSPTLKDALTQLKTWSEGHPDHTPVFITLEAKDGGAKDQPNPPEAFTEELFDELDRDLQKYLGKQHLITPDMVRSGNKTLESAVLKGNWPKLKNARGKFIFLLDDKDRKRALYMAGHPSLKARILFVNALPGTPEAAFMICNNPSDPQIPELVKKGYIIRTRADSDTRQARANDRTDLDAACSSGAQLISTDYYLKSTHFASDYLAELPGDNKYFRVNPVLK
jgi:hypothetical protein